MAFKKTQEEFLAEAKAAHGERYIYDRVEYKGRNYKVEIKCKIHGYFIQWPSDHIKGRGCAECGKQKSIEANRNKSFFDPEFIDKAKAIHGNKFDYSKVEYKNREKKIEIICDRHGSFFQHPYLHLRGHGCRKCSKTSKDTTAIFIKKARKVHGKKYDYSLVEYMGQNTAVSIGCLTHGVFTQKANEHLKGRGCAKCSGNVRDTLKSFIKKAYKVHGDIYDYTKVKYVNSLTKVTIVCKEHAEFRQVPNSHLQGRGCPECAGKGERNNDTFIRTSKQVHGDLYDYSKVDYKSSKTKVLIGCQRHGFFKQMPNHHLRGVGCSKCGASHGESKIELALKSVGMAYESQRRFSECKNNKPLPFDFYVPSCNLLIEYDGKQHFEPMGFFGGEAGLRIIQKHDKIKDEFASKCGYNLLRIKYTEFDRIEDILSEVLGLKQDAA
jgi:very-short-patch-repair endonuclease